MIHKIYKYITSEKRIDFFRKVDAVLRKCGGKLYYNTLGQLKYDLRYSNVQIIEERQETGEAGTSAENRNAENMFEHLCWKFDKEIPYKEKPLVSVIVPNYNHAPFLRERLESIYNQTYQNIEVILLDDCSKDNSREILSEYKERYPEKTITLFNETNAGKVFKQWNKGLQAAKGELVWIAESDDYCELNFLEKMVDLFQYKSVMIGFARSVFMQEGVKIWSTEEYLHDLPNLKWDAPFFMTANNIVQHGFAMHNIIPNVSSAMFRNIGKVPEEVERICANMNLSGDWIFYLNMIKGSVVAYTNETTNYYRIHPQSTSLKVQKTEDYYTEFEQVSCYVARNFKVDDSVYRKIYDNLERHYIAHGEVIKDFDLDKYYSIDKIKAEAAKREINIIMAVYALKSGGGETYPIFLANEMKKQGKTVTLLNFNFEESEDRIVDLIDPDVPVVNIKSTDYIGQVLYHLGCEVIHSHHASVDYALAVWIGNNPNLGKHIITLHGMYEAIAPEDCSRVIKKTMKECSKYIYIADKNLECFNSRGMYKADKFIKVPNGLPVIPIEPVEREKISIGEEDFVCVLASRGIPEKGWKEAIEAVNLANEGSGRKIHLVILGDGECRSELEHFASDTIHFVGTVSNVRDYFAMGDLGLLPSKFKGESYPLVIIECLLAGRPVLSTDIAEVPNQIVDEQGNRAGIMVPLKDWEFSVEDMAKEIKELANNEEVYGTLRNNTVTVSKKFDISEIVNKHLALYSEACGL